LVSVAPQLSGAITGAEGGVGVSVIAAVMSVVSSTKQSLLLGEVSR